MVDNVDNKDDYQELSLVIAQKENQLKELAESIDEAIEKGKPEIITQAVEFENTVTDVLEDCIAAQDFEAIGRTFLLVSEVSPKYQDFIMDMGTIYMQTMEYQLASECYYRISESSQIYTALFNGVLDFLKEQGLEEAIPEDIKEAISGLTEMDLLSQAFYSQALGNLNKMNRSPGDAIEYFQVAQDKFNILYEGTGDGIYLYNIQFSSACQIMMEALENIFRGNLTSAKNQFLQSKIAIERIIEDILPQHIEESSRQELETAMRVELNNCQAMYYLCDAKDQFARGAFSRAVEQYGQLCKISKETIDNYPEDLSSVLKNIALGDYYVYCGHKNLADGEWQREQEHWDNALESYGKARSEWEKAAESYIRSGVPQGVAMQETISNLSIDLESYTRQCGRERQLKNTIAEMQSEIKELMQIVQKATGSQLQINTISEAKSSADANVELNIDIRNEVKVNVRNLLKQLDESPVIDQDTKRELNRKAQDILQSEEQGPGFLNKVKNFTKDACDVVRKVGEAARPFLPLVAAICGAAGVPIPII